MPVKGTNRDKLNNTDIYDLLVKMNIELISRNCILSILEKNHKCEGNCPDCIQKWLNSR